MSKNDPQFNLRMPPHLNRKIRAAAAANKRPVTVEINSRLESTFALEQPSPVDAARDIISRAIVILRHFEDSERKR